MSPSLTIPPRDGRSKRPGFRRLYRQGGGVVIMFGMVASAGLRMIGEVEMNRRNMVILAVSLAIGSLQRLSDTLKILLTSGLLPTAFLAVTLYALLPKELKD